MRPAILKQITEKNTFVLQEMRSARGELSMIMFLCTGRLFRSRWLSTFKTLVDSYCDCNYKFNYINYIDTFVSNNHIRGGYK